MDELTLDGVGHHEAAACADIIFVHGLGGDPVGTWSSQDAPDTFWPRWLADDLADLGAPCRVWTLGYPAAATRWTGAGAMSLPDRAVSVLEYLSNSGIGEAPLLFVAHSLGGLVVKQLVRTASGFGSDRWSALLENTRAVVFIATPHSGTSLAKLAKALRAARASVAVDDLTAGNPYLRDLGSWYRQNVRALDIANRAYAESAKTPIMSFGPLTKSVMVVNESSADPGIEDCQLIPVDGNHWEVSKPPTRTSQLYVSVRSYLIDQIGERRAGAGSGVAAVTKSMGGHPSADITVTCERITITLLECGPFSDDGSMRTVFRHPGLAPWQNSVPTAVNPADRVRAVIDLLWDQRRSTGESALVLFLRVLSDQKSPEDECHQRLAGLAEELERALRSQTVGTESGSEEPPPAGTLQQESETASSADPPQLLPSEVPGPPRPAYVTLPEHATMVGREYELGVYRAHLAEHGFAVVFGEQGIGKTWVAMRLIRDAGFEDRCVMHRYTANQNFLSMCDSVVVDAQWSPGMTATSILRETLDTICGCGALLFFDNTEYLPDNPVVTRLLSSVLERVRAQHLNLVIASRIVPGSEEMTEVKAMLGLSFSDTAALLEDREVTVSDEAVRLLNAAYGGRPLPLRRAADRIRAAANMEQEARRLSDASGREQPDYDLEKLSHSALRVLEAAAVIGLRGGTMVVDSLEDLSGLEVAETVAAVEELVNEGFMDGPIVTDRQRQYSVHSDVAQYVVERTAPSHVSDLRKRASQLQIATPGDAPRLPQSIVATAEMLTDVQDCDGAVDLVYENSDPLVGAIYGEQVEQVLRRCERTTNSPRAFVRSCVVEARIRVLRGEHDAAREALDEAREHLMHVTPDKERHQLVAEVFAGLFEAARPRGVDDALGLVKEGLEALDAACTEERGLLLTKRGEGLSARGDYDDARATLEEAVNLLPDRPGRARASALLNLSDVYYRLAQGEHRGEFVAEAGKLYNKAFGDFTRLNDLWGLVDANFKRGLRLLDEGDLAAAEEEFERNIGLALRVGSVRQRVQNYLALAGSRILQGRLESGEELLNEQVLAVSREHAMPRFEASALATLGDAAVRSGQWAKALEFAKDALAMAETYRLSFVKPDALRTLAIQAYMTGATNVARDHAARAVTVSEELGVAEEVGKSRRVLGTVLYRLGRNDEARREFEKSLEELEDCSLYETSRTCIAWAYAMPSDSPREERELLLERARVGLEALGLDWELIANLEKP